MLDYLGGNPKRIDIGFIPAPWRSGSPELHHYFIGSKDGSCQILARSLEVELFPGRSRGDIIRTVYRRQREQFAETIQRIREIQEQPPPRE